MDPREPVIVETRRAFIAMGKQIGHLEAELRALRESHGEELRRIEERYSEVYTSGFADGVGMGERR